MIKLPSITLSATMENLDKLLEFVLKGVGKFDFATDSSLKKLRLVCEEMIVNIINHGYPEQTGKIKISYDVIVEEQKVMIEIIDQGIPFNPVDFKDPKLSSSIEERDIGGLGIYIAKKVVDEMKYKRYNSKNTLTLIKVIS